MMRRLGRRATEGKNSKIVSFQTDIVEKPDPFDGDAELTMIGALAKLAGHGGIQEDKKLSLNRKKVNPFGWEPFEKEIQVLIKDRSIPTPGAKEGCWELRPPNLWVPQDTGPR